MQTFAIVENGEIREMTLQEVADSAALDEIPDEFSDAQLQCP